MASITARGMSRCGSRHSSPSAAAASKPTNSVTPISTPLNASPIEVVLGLNTASVFPLAPPLAMITTARSSIGMSPTIANASMALVATRMPK